MKKYNPSTAVDQIIILKLGGSIITEKMSNRPQIRKRVIRQLAKELKLFIQRSPKAKIILLHGAGSFGHPLVYQYKLLERPLVGPQLLCFTKTICSMRHMANLLTIVFRSLKLPVLPIQASAVLSEKNNTMSLSNIQQLKQILSAGFIPLLGGDMGLTKKNKAIVVSADKLAILLAKAFPVSRLIFATDVSGVFYEFPASADAEPFSLLSRKKIKSILKKMKERKTRYDMTGGMAGKLQTMLVLQKKEIVVFNGLKQGNLTKALIGKPVGTRIVI